MRGPRRRRQHLLHSAGDVDPLRFGELVDRDKIAQEQQAAHPLDREQLFRQCVPARGGGVEEARRALADRAVEHELQGVGVGRGLDVGDLKALDSADSIASAMCSRIVFNGVEYDGVEQMPPEVRWNTNAPCG